MMMMMWLSIVCVLPASCPVADDYDPLRVPAAAEEAQQGEKLYATSGSVQSSKLSVADTKRNRELPILVYLPKDKVRHSVVLFSHGLGGNREGSAYLGRHWAARGYVSVFLQHPGSDDSIWKNERPGRRMSSLQSAATLANLRLRVEDVRAILDQLERWNDQADHPLHDMMNLERVGMSGHSFGAQTTQAVSGQAAGFLGSRFQDSRIAAALILSPSTPRSTTAEKAFGRVQLPWMLITGTLDASPIGDQTVWSRQEVFPALPAGDKYQLILDQALHSAFVERDAPNDRVERNPNHHRAVKAISTAFWDAYLRDVPQAKAWLQGDGPRGVLEPADDWQTK